MIVYALIVRDLICPVNQCERQPGGCANCSRAYKVCSGYRAQLDLAFCHETSSTSKRYSAKQHKNEDGVSEQLILSGTKLQAVPAFSEEDLFLASFYHHHLLQPPTDLITSEVLLASMSALGAASLSSKLGTAVSRTKAAQRYLVAVQVLNTALKDPTIAVQDATLFSVLVLEHYEMTAGTERRSIKERASHVKGTIALLELRGLDQVRSTTGRLLFLQVSIAILQECSRCAMRVPASVYDLLYECEKHIEHPTDPLWISQINFMQTTDLFSDFIHGNFTDATQVLKKAQGLDFKLSMTFSGATSLWSFTPIFTRELNQYAQNASYFHIYTSSLAAQLWNSVRSARLFLHRMIIQILTGPLRGDTHINHHDFSKQVDDSRAISTQLQLDILASVQQHISAAHEGNRGFFGVGTQHESVSGSRGISRAIDFRDASLLLSTARGYHLVWTLANVAEAGDIALRPRALEMMRLVGRHLGVQQANALIQAIEANQSNKSRISEAS